MNYSRGEVVWVRFPFSDSSTSKLRPALIISNNLVNRSGDYLLMQVTSRLRNDDLSLILDETAYSGSPLLKQSELRLHKVFILNEMMISGGITNLNAAFMLKVIDRFINLIR